MMNLENYIYKKRLSKIFLSLLFFIVFIFIFNFDFIKIINGFEKIGILFQKMYPFDFTILSSIYLSLLETLLIAVFSTFLGVLTTLLILPFLSNILFDIKILPKFISAVFSIFRTIPSLIIASILVSIFSVGSFSGFLSLYIISLLMSAKILKEYSEEINKKYIDTYLSKGFSKFKIYKIAILENMKTSIFSVYFLTLESNIRGASVLGLVGAGGIGQELWKELNHLRYDRVSLIVIILIFLILFIDFISWFFRNIDFSKKVSFKVYKFNKFISKILFLLMLCFSFYFSFKYLNISFDRFVLGIKNLKNMLLGFLSPDFHYSLKVFFAIKDSLLIAVLSTLFAGITSVFLSFLASESLFGRSRAAIFKFLINVFRTFPPIIVAIIFFRGFGPGEISSFFAIYFYTVGITTKMYSEVLESIDKNILYSIDSIGLSRLKGYFKIIFNGYFPEFVSIILLRFEMNIKNSTILGMVGVGGIGQLLINNIEFRNWEKVSVILIYLCIVIILFENISYYIREKIKK